MTTLERQKKVFGHLWQVYREAIRGYQTDLKYEPPPSDYIPRPDDPPDEELWMSRETVLAIATHNLRLAQLMVRMNIDAQRRLTNRPRKRGAIFALDRSRSDQRGR